MKYRRWQDAKETLKSHTVKVTDQQLRLAEAANIRIPAKTPKIVAAARLRIALAEELGEGPAKPAKEWMLESLRELSPTALQKAQSENESETLAWIQYHRFLSRYRDLDRLDLVEGDIVLLLDGRKLEVSSISSIGQVWFRGGYGARAWPDQIVDVIERIADGNAKLSQARTKVRNEAAKRDARDTWSAARQEDLRAYSVNEAPSFELLDELESVIDHSKDERQIQQFLQQNPSILTALLTGQHRFCFSQKRLGANYVADFIIGEADSIGMRWTLVEIETPISPVNLANGAALDKFARKGVSQIRDWRQWIESNIAHAKEKMSNNGLGLSGIRVASPGLVLVGRRTNLNKSSDAERLQLREQNDIHVHTYDWLLETARSSLTHSGPPALNPNMQWQTTSDLI